MKQISFAQAEHQNKKKVTCRERFLAQLFTLFALGNLVLAGRCQGHADGVSVS